MVGPSGSGKSTAWRVLLKALERWVVLFMHSYVNAFLASQLGQVIDQVEKLETRSFNKEYFLYNHGGRWPTCDLKVADSIAVVDKFLNDDRYL